jgi:transcriptional regulator with XRE-family HTH domain
MVDSQKPNQLTLEKAFGQRLLTLRKAKKMKQVEVSAATGYGQRTIGMIERGEKSPTLRTMQDFATFYDVALEDLIVQAKQLRDGTLD